MANSDEDDIDIGDFKLFDYDDSPLVKILMWLMIIITICIKPIFWIIDLFKFILKKLIGPR
jgi:hypothetical protein